MNEALQTFGGFLMSVHAIDLIVVLMLAEALFLSLCYSKTGRGIAPASLFPNLCAGLLLLLALRCALGGAAWVWVAACLAAALPAHVLDVARRWR